MASVRWKLKLKIVNVSELYVCLTGLDVVLLYIMHINCKYTPNV